MLFQVLYNTALLVLALWGSVKILIEAIRYGKHRRSLKEKLGWQIIPYSPQSRETIWIHAVSVGETKSAVPLVEQIRREYPHLAIVFSTTTETGQDEAKQRMPNLEGYFFLPFDLSWIIKKVVRQIQPKLLILVEGDFWYNLMCAVPQVILVNGKISENTLNRLRAFPFFAKKLFSPLRLLCVQSSQYAAHFEQLGVHREKIFVTGNLKLDQPRVIVDTEKWKKELGLNSQNRIITLGSTHYPEEEKILPLLMPLLNNIPQLKILLAPRHSERCEKIAGSLFKRKIPFALFTDSLEKKRTQSLLIINTIGILPICFQLSEISILGGSFIRGIGGHNIIEPILQGTPVLYGPHMESQKDLVHLVSSTGAGEEVSLEELPLIVEEWLHFPSEKRRQAGIDLKNALQGVTGKTLHHVAPFLSKKAPLKSI